MNKKMKSTDTDLMIYSSTVMVVEISQLRFEKDERYPWLEIYVTGDDRKELIEEIDPMNTEEISIIVTLEDLKIFALNWYFNNVEIVKKIKEEN